MYKKQIKRIIDIAISICLITLFLPVLIVLTLFLAFHFKSSPFFTQLRPGFQERPINIIKFKTMNEKTDEAGNLLPDKERLTPIGKIIRKLSLDELPQLFNVLKGDMSLIGPRPLLFKYLPLYNKEQKRRHNVRPGITGWAQVNGRNSISWRKKFEFDIYYVNNLSFALDAKIFWLTLYKIVKREGVNQSAERPMQPFNGEN